jgi:hypothetical protein
MLRPTYEVRHEGETFVVTVTPPAMFNLPPREIAFPAEQTARFIEWYEGRVSIQDAFPNLSASQRETLLTGLSDEDFDTFAGEDE